VVEIGQIKHLQVHAFRANIAPATQSGSDLVWRAGNPVLSKFGRLASDRNCPALDLGLVAAALGAGELVYGVSSVAAAAAPAAGQDSVAGPSNRTHTRAPRSCSSLDFVRAASIDPSSS
jgi:hypothetical protein